MAKGGGGKVTVNLLRVSGMVFAGIGAFHVLRYFGIVRDFDFTLTGSLIVGGLLLLLSFACFNASK